MGDSPLAQAFPDIFVVSLKQNATLAECWNSVQNSWDLGFRRGLFDREIASWESLIQLLDPVELGEGMDTVLWSLEKDGRFTTKSSFSNMMKTTPKLRLP